MSLIKYLFKPFVLVTFGKVIMYIKCILFFYGDAFLESSCHVMETSLGSFAR